MFGISFNELFIILALALIILGPDKLPELARTLGKGLGELKRATDDVTKSIMNDTGLKETANSLKESLKVDTGMSRDQLKGMFDDIEKGVKQPVEAEGKAPAKAEGSDGAPKAATATTTATASAEAEPAPEQDKPSKFADDDSD